jgi:hypothetical protein
MLLHVLALNVDHLQVVHELPEDGQQPRPKHVGATTNKQKIFTAS